MKSKNFEQACRMGISIGANRVANSTLACVRAAMQSLENDEYELTGELLEVLYDFLTSKLPEDARVEQ